MTISETKYIPTLDGWRAIAVLLVVGAHAVPMMRATPTRLGNAASAFFEHAGVGVDVFFALSGFLICRLLLQEKAKTGSIGLYAFYRRRLFRIVPPILVYLAVIKLLDSASKITASNDEIIWVLLFVRNFAGGGWYTGHFWSLAIEEHFYLFAPLIIAFLPNRRALQVALCVATTCVAIRTFEWYLSPDGSIFHGSKIEFRSESRFDGLMLGSVLAIVAHARTGQAWIMKNLTGRRVLATAVLAFVLLISIKAMPVRRTVVAVMLPLLIVYTVLHENGWLGRFLEVSWMRWVGKMSYSLYIWQMLFLVPAVTMPEVQNSQISLITAFSCALLSYYVVEKPAISLGRRLARSRSLTVPLA